MRSMSRMFGGGAALAAAVAFAMLLAPGCDRSSGKVKIGFIVKQPEEPWFQLEWKFAEEAAAKHGFELIKLPGKDGQEVQTAIASLATKGAKGFVICTPDVNLGPMIVDQANRHNLKLLAVDDQFKNPDGSFMTDVHYLGISARKIGEMVGAELAAQMKARNWPAEETAACVVTYDQLDTIKGRTEGAIAALRAAGFPEDRIFRAPQAKLDAPNSRDAVSGLLTQKQQVKRWLICGGNDSAVIGAVRAMEGRNIPADRVVGIGINGTDCITEFEQAQPTGFYASVLLSAREHGFKTAEMMYLWAKDGKEPPKDTRTTGVLITRENYKQVRKEQGITQ